MDAKPATPCAQCERLQQQVQLLQQAVATLTAQVHDLQAKLAAATKNSSNSSKPPSSDLVKPPKPAPPDGQRRRRGAQPGHPKHDRPPFTTEQLNGGTFSHLLDHCPDCGHAVEPVAAPPRVVQQMDLDVRLIPITVAEHRGQPAWCSRCLKVHYAPLPAAVDKGGLVGPGLTTLVAYLKGACHASYSTIRKFLRDVVGVSISRGQLAKVIAKVSDALATPYEELLQALPGQAVLNVDETSHQDDGQLLWTWCFRAELYTLFKIDPTRSADVLLEVLGREFDGVLGCDHFSAYRRFMRQLGVRVQFCLAHLIRDVKFLMSLPSVAEKAYGARLCVALEKLFGVVHRREHLSADEFGRQLQQARDWVLAAGAVEVPDSRPCQVMARRLAKYGAAYFTFLTTPGVEPTNNLAEQAIRFVVLDRVVTQGTRGETGQRWCERIWTVIASCAQQGRSVFDYLAAAVQAHYSGVAVPSLLPPD
jgi:transposase